MRVNKADPMADPAVGVCASEVQSSCVSATLTFPFLRPVSTSR
jgi:hypothetical protein